MLKTYLILTPLEQTKAIKQGIDINQEVNSLTFQNINDLFNVLNFGPIELGRPASCYVVEELTKRSIRVKRAIFYV